MQAAYARGKSIRTSSAGISLLLCLSIAACADVRWENAAVPEEQWALDRQACTASSYSQSRRLSDDSYITREMHRSGVDGDLARLRYTQQQDRQRRDAESGFDRCMTEKGYRRVQRP